MSSDHRNYDAPTGYGTKPQRPPCDLDQAGSSMRATSEQNFHRNRCAVIDRRDPSELTDRELLQSLLELVSPELDCAHTAARLLQESGGLARATHAGATTDISAHKMLRLVDEVAYRSARSRIDAQDVLSCYADLEAYLSLNALRETVRCCRVLYLTGGGHLIRDEVAFRGTANRVTCYPREIIRSALELSAIRVVVAFNHPMDEREASDEEKTFFKKLRASARLFEIDVHPIMLIH